MRSQTIADAGGDLGVKGPGPDCFIGGRSAILPGIEIVAGNPARILREGIQVGAYGRFADADATESALAAAGLA